MKKDSPKEEKGGKTPKLKKVLSGGIVMEEIKEGHGPEAKPRKMVWYLSLCKINHLQ